MNEQILRHNKKIVMDSSPISKFRLLKGDNAWGHAFQNSVNKITVELFFLEVKQEKSGSIPRQGPLVVKLIEGKQFQNHLSRINLRKENKQGFTAMLKLGLKSGRTD